MQPRRWAVINMDKKYHGRFNIQFDRRDAEHLRVIEILEGKRARGKASYIAAAILHYENCTETPIIHATPALDVKLIESVVYRILQAEQNLKAEPETTGQPHMQPAPEAIPGEQPNNESMAAAIQALGADNLQTIMGAVNAFRK